MSGVYIPNMQMPTSCRKCGLKMDCDHCESWECYCLPLQKNIGYMDDEPKIPSDKRRDDCPLVPVPEHGRLIDGDKVFKRLQKQAMSVWGDGNPRYQIVLEVMDAIRFAPTIIPAEEG